VIQRIALAGVALAMTFGAVGPAAAADPYEINMITSMTGGAAFLGQREVESMHALEAMVNKNGGIKGRQIKIVISDDQSNPQVAVQLSSQLAAKKVPFIFGPSLTAICQAVSGQIDKTGPVSFCLSPTIFPTAGGYTFMGAPSIDDVVPVIFRYFLSRKLTRLAVITSTDASGADFERRLAPVLARPEFKDIKIVTSEHFAPGDLTVAAQLARVKAANPDGLVTFTVGTPFGTLLKSIHESGLDVPVYGSGGNFAFAQMQQYVSFLPKDLVLNGSRGITPDPTATGAIKRAQDQYFAALAAANQRSEFAASIPWDPMMIMLEIVRRVGFDATPDQVHAAMENLKGFSGIEGTYDFTTHDQRGLGESATALFRYDGAKNEFVQIYPAKR
jgi:branched-chain amino acid transport system substrate-binding protein